MAFSAVPGGILSGVSAPQAVEWLRILLPVLLILIGSLIVVGAVKMKRLESFPFAIAASVLPVIFPVSFGGIVVAILSLLVLMRKSVRRAFQEVAQGKDARPQHHRLPCPWARWPARVLGTLWLLMLLMFVAGEGSPPLGSQPVEVQAQFGGLALILAGFALGWWFEGLAAVLALGGWTIFHVAEGCIRTNSLFHVAALVGVLYGISWMRRTPWNIAGLIAAPLVIALSINLNHATTRAASLTVVTGTVTDLRTGRPIARAHVHDNIYGATSRHAARETWTDTNGVYQLETFYEEHTIAAAASGYVTDAQVLVTKPFGFARKVRLDFKLTSTNTAPVQLPRP